MNQQLIPNPANHNRSLACQESLMPPSPAPNRAKSQKCMLLLFPMLHLTATRAQKPRFCAQKARKRGSRRPKKHKNPDFVLESTENWGSGGQKRTKTPILCSKSPKTRVSKGKSAQKSRFCAREERILASGSITAETLIVNVGFLQITARVSKM